MDARRTSRRNGIPMHADSGQQGPPELQWSPGGDAPLFGRRKPSGRNSCTIAAIIGVGILGIIMAVVLLPALERAREEARRVACQGNLKQMGIMCKAWAVEHDDKFPPLSATYGEFCPETDLIYPEFLVDSQVLVCLGDAGDPTVIGSNDPAIIGDESYFYLGYAMTNEAEARAFIDAYRQQMQTGGGFEEDLVVPAGSGTGGSDRIVRLREDLGNDLPVQPDEIPIMFDRSFNHHIGGGINVLYMDTHVEFRHEGEFPAQRWFLDALAELEE